MVVPGPRGWPLVGSLFDLARDPLAFVTSAARTHGDVLHYRMGRTSTFLVSHPDAIQEVLVDARELPVHKVTGGMDRLLGQGLLTSEGDLWKRQRKLAAPSFQPRQLAGYAAAMAEVARTAAAGWDAGTRDIHRDFVELSRDVVVRTLFGTATDAGRQIADRLGSLMEAFEVELRSLRRVLPSWVPTDGRRRVAEIRGELQELLDGIIATRRAEGGGDDLLSRLIAARDEDGSAMTDDQVRDEAMTLFLAGHETVASTLAFAAWLLADHPEVQDRARAEVDEVLGDRAPALADLGRLPWVDAVVREALRLYPPTWVMGRTVRTDREVGRYPVPAGAQVLMPQWVVHRDPRWWPDPERFLPERWLDGSAAAAPRFAYFPFGGGPRICIGNHFSMAEAAIVLASALRAVVFRPQPGFALTLMAALTLRPRACASR